MEKIDSEASTIMIRPSNGTLKLLGIILTTIGLTIAAFWFIHDRYITAPRLDMQKELAFCTEMLADKIDELKANLTQQVREIGQTKADAKDVVRLERAVEKNSERMEQNNKDHAQILMDLSGLKGMIKKQQ